MEAIIQTGYRVTVVSWENDDDAKRSIIKEGLTREVAAFFVDFARLFYSKNDHEHPGFGNMGNPTDEEAMAVAEAMKRLLAAHFNTAKVIFHLKGETVSDSINMISIAYDLHDELFGIPEYEGFRVLEGVTVEYIPVNVCLEDVTNQFVTTC